MMSDTGAGRPLMVPSWLKARLEEFGVAMEKAFDETKHRRHPKGSPKGGKFMPKGGGQDSDTTTNNQSGKRSEQVDDAIEQELDQAIELLYEAEYNPDTQLDPLEVRPRVYQLSRQLAEKIDVGESAEATAQKLHANMMEAFDRLQAADKQYTDWYWEDADEGAEEAATEQRLGAELDAARKDFRRKREVVNAFRSLHGISFRF